MTARTAASAPTTWRANQSAEGGPLHIVLDGVVYGFQKHGGINTYVQEIMTRLSPPHTMEVLMPPRAAGTPPRGPGFRNLRRDIFPSRTNLSWKVDQYYGRLSDRVNGGIRDLRIRSRRCVFHSTYFTIAPTSVPQVAVAHDMNHELFPERFDPDWRDELRGLYHAYLAAATRVIAVSEKTREDVLRFYPVDPERVDVIHHATNPDTFYAERDDEGLQRLAERWGFREPYLLFVGGRISFYKNFDGLAAGYARSKCRDDVQLVVAGKKWLPEEEELLARLGLGDRVRLVENPDDDDLRRLYNHAVAYVFPSLHEGFGIPLLEAMACGTPVLAADTAVFREVAGAAAHYFDPYDPDAIAAALESALDPAVRSRLAGLGRERLRQFSWDKAARQTEQVYLRARAEFQGR